MNQYYQNSMEQQASEEQKEQFDQYLQLYQNCIITGKSKKELDIASNQLLEEMVEKYQEENREAYIQQIERFYQAGFAAWAWLWRKFD